MGAEFLSDGQPTRDKSYGEIFEENFPFYLAIGMSYGEYWEGDANLARSYRKAYRLRQEEFNTNAWLQGMYIYDAVSCALHNALRGMGKSKPPAKDYAKEPYEIFKKEKTSQEVAQEIEKEQEKALLWMESLVQKGKRA